MAKFFTGKEDKMDFRVIMLEHLKRILEISCQEFHGGYKNTRVFPTHSEEIYIENNRKKYIQSIESLYDILLPYFDKKMMAKSDEIETAVDEIKEEVKSEKTNITLGSKEEQEFIIRKMEYARKLFQELNLLMSRKGYLKGSVYAEGKDDLDIVADDEIGIVDIDE